MGVQSLRARLHIAISAAIEVVSNGVVLQRAG